MSPPTEGQTFSPFHSIEHLPIPDKSQLELTVYSRASASCTLRVAGYTKHGTFSMDVTPATDRSLTTSRIRLPDLPISMHCDVESGTIRRGQCYCHIEVEVGRMPIMALSSGYVTPERPLFSPGGPHEGSTEGPGYPRIITGTNPAAGSEISEAVPTNARWKLVSLKATLVADGTVANRNPKLAIDDGSGAVPIQGVCVGNVTASQTVRIDAMRDITPYAQNAGEVSLPIPGDQILFQGWLIKTVTTNLQAGDDYGAPIYEVEEWIEE